MSTALDAWGTREKTEGAGDREVLEAELRGDGDSTGIHLRDPHDSTLSAHEGDENFTPEDVAAAEEQAAARALKQKQGMRVIYGAVGVVVLLVGGLVAMKTLRPAQVQSEQQVQAVPQAQQDQTQVIAQVGQQPGLQAQPIIDGAPVAAPASAPAALDFGLQAPSPQASAAALVPATVLPPVAKPIHQEVVSPQAQLQAQLPVNQPAAKSGPDVSSAELEKVRFELTALKSTLAERGRDYEMLRGELASLREKLASRPVAQPQASVAPKQAAPKVDVPKPAPAKVETKVAADKVVEPVAATAAATQAPAAAKSKAKVRSDYAIYAFVDQRFWVKGADGEPFAIGPDSPLPDGTRVTGLDKDKAIVYTSTGEIR